jgi:hypothetical protein
VIDIEVAFHATGFEESAVNPIASKRFAKRQQCMDKEGTHLLLQTRTRVLDGQFEETFRKVYPVFRPDAQQQAALAPAF